MRPMRTMQSIRWAAIAVAAAACLAGCAPPPDAPAVDATPVTLTPVAGTHLYRVTLSERAVQRLGIRTAPVRRAPAADVDAGSAAEVIPYAAVVYDADGSTWTYANTSPHTYQRAPIVVASIIGADALLTKGPAVGTAVVVVGAPELLGAEYQISGEE